MKSLKIGVIIVPLNNKTNFEKSAQLDLQIWDAKKLTKITYKCTAKNRGGKPKLFFKRPLTHTSYK